MRDLWCNPAWQPAPTEEASMRSKAREQVQQVGDPCCPHALRFPRYWRCARKVRGASRALAPLGLGAPQ